MSTRDNNAETGLKGKGTSGDVSIPVVEGGEVGEFREYAGAYKMGVYKQIHYLTKDRRCREHVGMIYQ